MIRPLHDRLLIKLDRDDKVGSIYLGGKLIGNTTRIGTDQHSGNQVEVAGGGAPVGRSLVIVEKEMVVRVNGTLQEPYVRMIPEEAQSSGLIDVIQDYFSGWYVVKEAYPEQEDLVGKRCLPFYGTPYLPLRDDSEYRHVDSIALVEEM